MIRDSFFYLVLALVVLFSCVLPALQSDLEAKGAVRALTPVSFAVADVPVVASAEVPLMDLERVREDVEASVALARDARLQVEALIVSP